jgi:hypothetical protein
MDQPVTLRELLLRLNNPRLNQPETATLRLGTIGNQRGQEESGRPCGTSRPVLFVRAGIG